MGVLIFRNCLDGLILTGKSLGGIRKWELAVHVRMICLHFTKVARGWIVMEAKADSKHAGRRFTWTLGRFEIYTPERAAARAGL